MKIRSHGTGAGCRQAAGIFVRRRGFPVLAVPAPYADRGAPAVVRMYAGVRMDPLPADGGQRRNEQGG